MNEFLPDHALYKENSIVGRYVINEQISAYLKGKSSNFEIEELGTSVENRNISSITLGSGPKRILMWSQMHGNESTTTKAVIDFIDFIIQDLSSAKALLADCTIKIIPMLNPDGAAVYTRVNANNIDLNRDAQDRSQPESILLRKVFDYFQPHYCFNLHDQRTLFNVGDTPKTATISFLAPSHDKERSISATREKSMQLIAAMNKALQQLIPGQIGRYDDSFNANCVGDAFQMRNTPTVLFEAGHFPDDYQRERTREYIFYAIWFAIDAIAKDKIRTHELSEYFEIPENKKMFYDILIKNVQLIKPSVKVKSDMGLLYKEKLVDGTIHFIPQIEKIGDLTEFYGHQVFNCLDGSDVENLKKQSFWQQVID